MLKKTQFIFFAICLIVTFVSINIALSLIGRRLSTDITSDKKYSLSDETKEWLASNEKDVFIRLYVSADWKNNHILKEYSTDVLRLLEEYQLKSKNKISIKVIEVRPFSVAAAEAKKFGLKGEKEEMWLGLILSDELGHLSVIPYLNPLRKSFLEYDITKILTQLNENKKPKVGVLSSEVNVKRAKNSFEYRNDWAILNALKKEYDFEFVNPQIAFIDDDIDVLMIVNPKRISSLTAYAIDQYLIRGGNLLIFLDPLSEVALAKGSFNYAPSGLEKLLDTMGIKYDYRFLIADLENNRYMNLNHKKKIKYPLWVNVLANGEQHKLLENTDWVQMNTAGLLEFEVKEGLQANILLASSLKSGITLTLDALNLSYNILSKNINLTNEKLVLGALVEGKFISAYIKPLLNTEQYISGKYAFRSVSLEPSKVAVFTDSDLLNTRLWNINTLNVDNTYDYIPYGGNLIVVEKILRYLTGKKAMLPMPKQSHDNVMPLKMALRAIAERIYTNKTKSIERELTDLEAKQIKIDEMIKEQGNIPSVQVVQEMENIQRRQLELRNKQEKNKYQIMILYKVIFGVWLLLNFVLPIIFISVVVIVMKHYNKKNYILAEKIANEN